MPLAWNQWRLSERMTSEKPPQPQARAFLVAFAAMVGLGLTTVIAAMTTAGALGLLPPPPLVATDCIDRKFEFLAERDLESVELIAMGSSGAWRNLDMTVFADTLDVEPLNAAPCHLQAHQSAFMTAFLAPRMPTLETVVFVALPRDFERCAPGDRAFFDPGIAGAILDGRAPVWTPYVTGFETTYMVQNIIAKLNRTGNFGVAEYDDGFGSNPLLDDLDWAPAWAIDPTCFDHLQSLEQTLTERGVDLVVAFAPVQPDWLAAVDPSGVHYAAFRREVQNRLSPTTLVVAPWPEGQADPALFADTQHLRHPHERAFSAYIADRIRTRAAFSDAAG